MVHFEDNLNLNNLERNTAVAVKYVGNKAKYQVGETIDLGRLGKGSILRKVYAIVDEAFPPDTQILVGQITGENNNTTPIFTSWTNVYPNKRGVFHVPLYVNDNFEPNGSDYTGEDKVAVDNHMRVGVQFYNNPDPASEVGSMRVVFEYDYVENTQTGAYL